MSKRTVFGRRKVDFEGKEFILEMRVDGIFVRRKRGRYEWKLPFQTLLNHAKLQPELFFSDETPTDNAGEPVQETASGEAIGADNAQ